MNTPTIAIGVLCLFLAQASSEVRVDTFDKNSRRTGYLVIDQRTGRVDQFDTHGNRLGYGSTQPSVPGRGSDLLDRNGRSIYIDRKYR